MKTTQTSGYLPVGDRFVYVTLHTAPQRRCSSLLLLLAPFGEERKCACRLLVRTARAFVEAGGAAVRCHLSGTGDSTSAHGDATLARWLQDASSVLDWATATVAAPNRGVLGARLGANLAVRLAATGQASHLTLLEPLLSGADFIRDLARRQQIKRFMGPGGPAAAADTPTPAAVPEQATDFGGYEVGATLRPELLAMELQAELAAVPAPCRVHLVKVAGTTGFPRRWADVVDGIANRPESAAVIRRARPFWGQLEYHESDVIPDTVLDFLQPFLGEPPHVPSNSDS